MNIIICEKKELLFPIVSFINLDKFIIVSSQLDAKILVQKSSANYIIYEKTAKVDIRYFIKHSKYILSFDEFINIVSAKNNKSQKCNDSTDITKEQIANSNIGNSTKGIYSIYSNTNKSIKASKKKEIIATAQKDTATVKQNKAASECNYNKKVEHIIHDSSNSTKSTKDNNFSNQNKTQLSAAKNKIYTFTSVKGGAGVSSLITQISQNKDKKLILDLGFNNGGSDLSYYFNLPQVPHMGTYIIDSPDNLNDHIINITENTAILQAPPTRSIYEKIDIKDILNVIQYSDYNTIIIDLPINSSFTDFILPISKKIYIVTSASPMEINRIQNTFKEYINKVKCLIINPKDKGYRMYLNECNLKYMVVKNPSKDCQNILKM